MALIVEDGSVVAGANTYVTLEEYLDWAHARGMHPQGDNEEEYHILRAMDYIEKQPFLGTKANENQPLQWPRHRVWIDGYPIDSNQIPNELKIAVFELAQAHHDNDDLLAPVERQTIQETIGGISVTYAKSQPQRRSLPAVRLALQKLVYSASTVSRS